MTVIAGEARKAAVLGLVEIRELSKSKVTKNKEQRKKNSKES
jgi:hypothetical protein